MTAPKPTGTFWGWALIEGEPEYIEFNEYEGDPLAHSVNPEHDYMMEKGKVAKTKNELLDRQVEYCRGHRDRWEHSMKWFEGMKDPEPVKEVEEAPTPSGPKPKFDSAEELIECPACATHGCEHCRNRGWLTKFGEKMYYQNQSQGT